MAKRNDFSDWAMRYAAALELRADHAGGRICWDTAKHLHNSGATPESAAANVANPYIAPTQHSWRT
jgi:hypothetical protein